VSLAPLVSRAAHTVAPDTAARDAQWQHALGRANDVRRSRAGLKRDLAAGSLSIVSVLADPPAYAETANVRQLLLALPKFGPVKARRLLAQCQIPESKTVARLSDRQRAALIEHLSK
jgi:hypothetical protein